MGAEVCGRSVTVVNDGAANYAKILGVCLSNDMTLDEYIQDVINRAKKLEQEAKKHET